MEIVHAIAQLAQTLGMDVVAEGVEDREALGPLREFGCDYAQGYLVSKPAPSDQVLDLLTERIPW